MGVHKITYRLADCIISNVIFRNAITSNKARYCVSDIRSVVLESCPELGELLCLVMENVSVTEYKRGELKGTGVTRNELLGFKKKANLLTKKLLKKF